MHKPKNTLDTDDDNNLLLCLIVIINGNNAYNSECFTVIGRWSSIVLNSLAQNSEYEFMRKALKWRYINFTVKLLHVPNYSSHSK